MAAGPGSIISVLAEDVANVLAEKTFDALAEFLRAFHIALLHFPFDAGARLERRNFRVDLCSSN